jgi:hypothetical protein
LRCRAQEEAEFREYAALPNVLDLIPKRIAPQIFGAERIKEAVACLLFGGSRKVWAAHAPTLPSSHTKQWHFQQGMQALHEFVLHSQPQQYRNAAVAAADMSGPRHKGGKALALFGLSVKSLVAPEDVRLAGSYMTLSW